jgi:hypothetical protein
MAHHTVNSHVAATRSECYLEVRGQMFCAIRCAATVNGNKFTKTVNAEGQTNQHQMSVSI